MDKPTQPLFTRDFINISLVSLLLFSGHYLVLATLPAYILLQGGDLSAVGLVSSMFAISALVFRPVVGFLVDRFGRVPVIQLGAAGTALAGLGFFFSGGIFPLISVRFAQGAGFSAISTGGSVLVGDIAPLTRRAEAVGYYGMFGTIALALMPTVGQRLVDSTGYTGLFVAVVATAVMAFLISTRLREPQGKAPPSTSILGSFFCREAIAPSLVALLFAADFGAIVSFMPLYLSQAGYGDPALFFTPYAIAVLAGRALAGRFADKFGRIQTVVPGLAVGSLSLYFLSLTPSVATIVSGAVCFALGMSMVQPALTALILDRVSPGQRGAALGTFFAAFDLGIGAGSTAWGVVAQQSDFGTMFGLAALTPLVAAAYLLGLTYFTRKRRQAAASGV